MICLVTKQQLKSERGPQNRSPIRIRPVHGKLIEKIIFDQILKFLSMTLIVACLNERVHCCIADYDDKLSLYLSLFDYLFHI